MHMLQNGGNMPDQKLDNLLNLALDATEEEREKSRNLNVGYEKQTRKWEIIVKYSEMGDSVEALLGGSGISVVPLLGGYAIVTLPESMLEEYSRRPQIEFIEKPTRLYFEAAPPAAHHVPYQTGSLPHILLHHESRRAYRKLPIFLRQAGYSLTVH